MNKIAKELVIIAKEILAYEGQEQDLKEIQNYLKNFEETLESFRMKQVSAIERLQNEIDFVQEAIEKLERDGEDTEELDERLKDLSNKIMRKDFYLTTEGVKQKDLKNYQDLNQKYIDGLMRMGGIKKVFEKLSNELVKELQFQDILNKYQVGIRKFSDGSYLRAIMSKQSERKQTVSSMIKAGKFDVRFKRESEKIEKQSHNIWIDLVDAKGNIVALQSFANKNVQEFRARMDEIYNDKLKKASVKTAGVLDFIKNMFNVGMKFITKLVNSVKKLFKSVDDYKSQNTKSYQNIIDLLEGMNDIFE